MALNFFDIRPCQRMGGFGGPGVIAWRGGGSRNERSLAPGGEAALRRTHGTGGGGAQAHSDLQLSPSAPPPVSPPTDPDPPQPPEGVGRGGGVLPGQEASISVRPKEMKGLLLEGSRFNCEPPSRIIPLLGFIFSPGVPAQGRGLSWGGGSFLQIF